MAENKIVSFDDVDCYTYVLHPEKQESNVIPNYVTVILSSYDSFYNYSVTVALFSHVIELDGNDFVMGDQWNIRRILDEINNMYTGYTIVTVIMQECCNNIGVLSSKYITQLYLGEE